MGDNLYLCPKIYICNMKHIRPILMMLCGLWLLYGCGADKEQMLRQLEQLEQANRADSVMRNDSLAKDLVACPTNGCVPTTSSGAPIAT